MTDSTGLDIITWVQRQSGISREDAERIVTRITADACRVFAEQQAAQPPPEPARLQPISITFTAEVDTTAIVDAIRNAGALT
jgi:hypothetical protein